jgi:hypothetical protein
MMDTSFIVRDLVQADKMISAISLNRLTGCGGEHLI